MFFDCDLDPVEVFHDVEDAFGVKIPEEEYMQIKTTNDLVDVVTRLCGAGPGVGNPCLTARAFYSLGSKLVQLVPLQRQEIRPSSNLESLIPKEQRRRVWKSLRDGGTDLPRLSMRNIPSILTFLAVLAPSFYVLSAFAEQYDPRFWMSGFGILGVLLLLTASLMATFGAPWPWATRIPGPYHTVRDVATHLACLDVQGRSSGLLSHDEVAQNVRLIIANSSGFLWKDSTRTRKSKHLFD